MTEDQLPAEMAGRMVVGSPDRIAEQIKTNVIDVGIDGVIVNVPFYAPGCGGEGGRGAAPGGRASSPRGGPHHVVRSGIDRNSESRATTVETVLCMSLRSKHVPSRCDSVG